MRLRTAVLGLATGVAVTLTACGNGPPPGQDTTSGGGGGGGGGAETSVASGTAAQKVDESVGDGAVYGGAKPAGTARGRSRQTSSLRHWARAGGRGCRLGG